LTDISLPKVEYSGVLAVYLNPGLKTFNSGITLVGSIKFEVTGPHIVGASRRDSCFQDTLDVDHPSLNRGRVAKPKDAGPVVE
jgi:hypothetical protein